MSRVRILSLPVTRPSSQPPSWALDSSLVVVSSCVGLVSLLSLPPGVFLSHLSHVAGVGEVIPNTWKLLPRKHMTQDKPIRVLADYLIGSRVLPLPVEQRLGEVTPLHFLLVLRDH